MTIFQFMAEARLLKQTIQFMGKILAPLRKAIDWAIALPFRLVLCHTTKVQNNKVLFTTFNHQYSCNPKYIYQEIQRQGLPIQPVWVINSDVESAGGLEEAFPKNMKLVVRGTYEFFKEQAAAKVWVDNAFNCTWDPFPKKKDQFYIQNWHGSLGLKRIGRESVKSLRWSLSALLNGRYVDVCISNSTFETEVYRQTHWPKNQILELGHARNDIFFADEATKAAIKAKVLCHYGIDEHAKIALYAPTFRTGDSTAVFDLDHSRFLDALQSRFGGEWVLLNRYHFKTKNGIAGNAADRRILSATDYPDIQELMVAADVGITDYSSWIYDFMLTGRPGFLYVPDLKEYDQSRGFYYPLSETPFPYAETNDEMVDKVLSFDRRTYAAKHAEFLQARGCKEQGTAAKAIVEIIKQQCGLV